MIPANSIHFNEDGTAWWVFDEHLTTMQREEADRPCDACDGDLETLIVRHGVVRCPDCHGTGRHVFGIEVECDESVNHHPESTSPCTSTRRVFVVPGMVLGIFDPVAGCPGPASPHICWSSIDRRVGSDTDGCWLLVTGTLHDASPSITLPPAAKPGDWAVQLQEVHQ